MKYPLDYLKTNGISALGIAALKGDIRLCKMLVEAGADVNVTSKNGIGALYMALKGSQEACAKYLI